MTLEELEKELRGCETRVAVLLEQKKSADRQKADARARITAIVPVSGEIEDAEMLELAQAELVKLQEDEEKYGAEAVKLVEKLKDDLSTIEGIRDGTISLDESVVDPAPPGGLQ